MNLQKAIYKIKAVGLRRLLFAVIATDPKNPDVATIKGFEGIFANIVFVAFSFAGLVLFVMFVIGGFKYMTSQGDPKSVDSAKGTLTHAIIGLIVLLLAYAILVIVKDVTNVDVTNFRVTH